MTGWDIVSILVLALLAGLFFRGWGAQQLTGARRGASSGSPQSLLESGGYREREPVREVQETIHRGPASEDRPEPKRERPRQASEQPARRPDYRAEVRHRLSSPDSARIAFVMREVLDTPVGMRDEDPV